MKKFLPLLAIAAALIWPTGVAEAIEYHSDTNLRFTEGKTLNNAYLSGSQIQVEAEVQNDLVAAGNSLEVSGPVTGSIMAVAGEIDLTGQVDRSVRVAGSSVSVNSKIGQDLLLLATEATIGNDAEVGGDVVFFGNSLTVNGKIDGQLIINCACDVDINNEVGSVLAYRVGQLTLGPNARVDGPLKYSSHGQAIVDREAMVNGATDYTEVESQSFIQSASNFFFLYGLLASMIFTLTLLLLFRRVVGITVGLLRQNALLALGIGLAILVVLPLLSAGLMTVSVWLGLAGLSLFVLLLFVGIGLAQLILGWWLLYWWMGRSGQLYLVDWRAALIGVVVSTILIYVPVVGWFILFVALLLALGGLGFGLWQLRLPVGE